ncbi:hypothetical protein YUWDRAFT_03893 [Streptomyces sp. AmelKG-D3]|nr:hypothetical protein YUWDRAFT_03893 [Streptomyces sp. AmelKG-D3]
MTGGTVTGGSWPMSRRAAHAVWPLYGDRVVAPSVRIPPTAPLHEMFTEAWERSQAERGGAERSPERALPRGHPGGNCHPGGELPPGQHRQEK